VKAAFEELNHAFRKWDPKERRRGRKSSRKIPEIKTFPGKRIV